VVLGISMKRGIFIFFGVCTGLVIGALFAYAFNSWYASRYVRSDDDSNILVTLVFIFLPAFAVAGGVAASRLYSYSRRGT
jgi:hypothetical protein